MFFGNFSPHELVFGVRPKVHFFTWYECQAHPTFCLPDYGAPYYVVHALVDKPGRAGGIKLFHISCSCGCEFCLLIAFGVALGLILISLHKHSYVDIVIL